jgi:hypothetical protein
MLAKQVLSQLSLHAHKNYTDSKPLVAVPHPILSENRRHCAK